MVHQIAPSAFKMKKGGGHIFQLSLICTLKAIEVIKKVKKRKKDWVIELRQINTLCQLPTKIPITCALVHFVTITLESAAALGELGQKMHFSVRKCTYRSENAVFSGLKMHFSV